MATSITANGLTFTFNEWDIDNVKSTIVSGAEQTETTISGPSGAYVIDTNGARKRIEINGKLTVATSTRLSGGYTITTILQQKQWLESLVNGNQYSITFVSAYESQSVSTRSASNLPYLSDFVTTKCIVEAMSFDDQSGLPNLLPFSIVLLVGGLSA